MPFDSMPEVRVRSQVELDLEAALELLGPNGEYWCRYSFRRGAECGFQYCAVGALMEVLGVPFDVDFKAGDFPRLDGAFMALQCASAGRSPQFYNDMVVRNFSDLRAWFARAEAFDIGGQYAV